MTPSRPTTLGALKESGYVGQSVREEVRRNLIARLRDGSPVFHGVVGYDDTVVPQLVQALLAKQTVILLGLRGQAKSRMVRQLVDLLDPEIPIIAGSEVNDDPLRPISRHGKTVLEECGDSTPIDWVTRDARFVEKLATPDVTIADIIGDVDPIKAARGGHVLSDEMTIHFGLLPRANRGIFAVNELPDLSGKIQVGLFNVLQEGDVQIKGYPVRLPLDVLTVFTANPEDYTARGKIITPLKDRIGAEVRTHYPESVETGVRITRQEAWVDRGDVDIEVPDVVASVIERVAFLAREDKRVDQRSGVSQRLPIAALENAASSAERRALLTGEPPVVRISDVYAALPAIEGKLELEYEGELQGSERVARELIGRASAEALDDMVPEGVEDELAEVVDYFDRGGVLQVGDTAAAAAALEGLTAVAGLEGAVRRAGMWDGASPGARVAGCELVLEALAAERRISRSSGGAFRRRRARKRPAPPSAGGPSLEA
ncbi:MAG: magnesium chelatase [Gemmatimonadota bacterium]